jgi:hypothetical protein
MTCNGVNKETCLHLRITDLICMPTKVCLFTGVFMLLTYTFIQTLTVRDNGYLLPVRWLSISI